MNNKFWAIEPTFRVKYREFKENLKISASDIESFSRKAVEAQSAELVIVDEVAIIDIVGNLSNRFSFYNYLFSGATSSYRDIIDQLNAAEVSPLVKSVQLRVNSPGGRVDGLFDLLYKIKSFSKPVESLVGARADSAAYGIVSQTDKIIAANEMSEVGSIGVGVSFYVSNNIVDITSSDAPDKWPDVTQKEGVDVIRAELDEIHERFAGIIADGRAAATGKSITVATVNTNFGRGGVMLSEAGLKNDMIDEIIPAPDRISNADFFSSASSRIKNYSSEKPLDSLIKPEAVSVRQTEKQDKMDLNTLKKEHPEVYQAACDEGASSERKRVNGLLIAGKGAGKMDYALECVEKGLKIGDDEVQATFLTARMNKADADEREKENPEKINPPEAKDKKESEEEEVKSYLKHRKSLKPTG